MKYLLFAFSLFLLSACGGGSDSKSDDTNKIPDDGNGFILHNVRFDARDFFDGESVTVTEGKSFEVQWVSPSSESYRIDLYLSSNAAPHSDNNKIVGLKCGGATFSLCPNATGQVQCEIDDNNLACAIGNDPIGNRKFLEKDLANLSFIIKGCDALSNCDLKTFKLSVQTR